jgi:hypothetical protein
MCVRSLIFALFLSACVVSRLIHQFRRDDRFRVSKQDISRMLESDRMETYAQDTEVPTRVYVCCSCMCVLVFLHVCVSERDCMCIHATATQEYDTATKSKDREEMRYPVAAITHTQTPAHSDKLSRRVEVVGNVISDLIATRNDR